MQTAQVMKTRTDCTTTFKLPLTIVAANMQIAHDPNTKYTTAFLPSDETKLCPSRWEIPITRKLLFNTPKILVIVHCFASPR